MKRIGMFITALVLLGSVAALPQADAAPTYRPGDSGAGDDYFPLDGNGGYDVGSYRLDVRFDPASKAMEAVATIDAVATQGLSRFNLDLDGLTVRTVTVGGAAARWSRSRGELVVTPVSGIAPRTSFRTVVRYDGVPQTFDDLGTLDGALPTDDGALILGEPHVASAWYPVNDHPTDKATYDIRLTVPAGVEALSNGRLVDQSTQSGWTTWRWSAAEPMSSYLAMAAIGQFDIDAYAQRGIRYWDAIDPRLFDVDLPAPRTGAQYAFSQATAEGPSYKRLSRTLHVPSAGAQVSFWIDRATEDDFDFVFVEAHTVGGQDWTTLPDLNGHTHADTGLSCPFSLELHPFLGHYQADSGDGSCSTTGSTGTWSAASGTSDGYEQWAVDLARFAGSDVELSVSYASDDTVQLRGAVVDDVTVSTGEGSTSFEADGDVMDGWTVPGAPPGSAVNSNDWLATDADIAVDAPTVGDNARASLARQPEIIAFLSSVFGKYPFATSGGVVDRAPVSFALENQGRVVYSPGFFDGGPNTGVVVHELAHQWYGDSLGVRRWADIWLNEGFATYAEWLWLDYQGEISPQEIYDFFVQEVPADDPFWALKIGDPQPDHLFDDPVYSRGALTLQALRMQVGDDAFFRILRAWASENAGGNVDTGQFIALAERTSGQQLDALFDRWLYTTSKPVADAMTLRRSLGSPVRVPAALHLLLRAGPRP